MPKVGNIYIIKSAEQYDKVAKYEKCCAKLWTDLQSGGFCATLTMYEYAPGLRGEMRLI